MHSDDKTRMLRRVQTSLSFVSCNFFFSFSSQVPFRFDRRSVVVEFGRLGSFALFASFHTLGSPSVAPAPTEESTLSTPSATSTSHPTATLSRAFPPLLHALPSPSHLYLAHRTSPYNSPSVTQLTPRPHRAPTHPPSLS